MNSPACAEVVAQHRADPTLPVQVKAELLRIGIPGPWDGGSGDGEVHFVVTGMGFVDEDTIEIVGDVPSEGRQELTEATLKHRYRPARADECWVASVQAWSFRS
ncbi:MAG: hypothetical protein ABFS34_00830 [Gemmatimonadota bacterium]